MAKQIALTLPDLLAIQAKQYWLDFAADHFYNERFWPGKSFARAWLEGDTTVDYLSLPRDEQACQAEQCLVETWIELGEIDG